MARIVHPIERLEEVNRLIALQSDYKKVTRNIVASMRSIAELNGSQNDTLGYVQKFEDMTRQSKQVLEELTLNIQALIEHERQLKMEELYASPRDRFLR